MSTKISNRIAASALTGAELLGIVKSGLDRRSTMREAGPFLHANTYGVKADGVTDDTTALNNAIAAAVNQTLILPNGPIRITSALVIPSSSHIVGTGNGGNFGTSLRPDGCGALTIDTVNQVTIENVMIWLKGTAATNTILINDCYSIRLKNMRIHLDTSGAPPTDAVIAQTAVSTGTTGGDAIILYENIEMRSDDILQWFPVGFRFADKCGQALLLFPDIETCITAGIKHDGGRITVLYPWFERQSTSGILTQAASDARSALAVFGGIIASSDSGVPLRIADSTNAKDVSIIGTVFDRPDGTTQGHVTDLGGPTKNIYIEAANFDPDKWASDVSLDPAKIKFVGVMRPLPASKYTSINVTTGTLAVGDITGAAFTHLLSINATPGNQTTRTATQMVIDMNGMPQDTYALRISNTGAGTFTLIAGTGVTLTGTMTVLQNFYRDFIVTINSKTTLTIQTIGTIAFTA